MPFTSCKLQVAFIISDFEPRDWLSRFFLILKSFCLSHRVKIITALPLTCSSSRNGCNNGGIWLIVPAPASTLCPCILDHTRAYFQCYSWTLNTCVCAFHLRISYMHDRFSWSRIFVGLPAASRQSVLLSLLIRWIRNTILWWRRIRVDRLCETWRCKLPSYQIDGYLPSSSVAMRVMMGRVSE